MPLQELLSIGELSRRTGMSVSAIRFYEAQGLVKACLLYTSPSPRDS